MRFVGTDRRRILQRGLIALGLLVMSAAGARAQLVFDGNILWNNNATGTLAGQFVGTAGAGATSCAPGLTAATLGTVTYTHNAYSDPLLPFAPYVAGQVPDFRPQAGSPAYSGTRVQVPSNGFFEQVCHAGALSADPAEDWTRGWTYYDSTGANRQDLHLAGMPDPRPLAIYDNIGIFGHAYWSADSNYLIRGQLRVKSLGTLHIAPGVVVFQDDATVGTLLVERGGRLFAIGEACAPIIVTSDQPPGTQARGGCGGIIINGYARTNTVNSCAGDSAASEGGAVGYYGGNDDDWSAGVLKYVRVEYAGVEITPNNELNAFTWNACGRGTRGDYLQAHRGADDGFEWFGGTMGNKHLIATDGTDDGYDWQLGTRNQAQFVIVRVSAQQSPNLGQNGDKGIEADNIASGSTQCSGRSNSIVANATFVGDKRSGPGFPGSGGGVNWRIGTGGTLLNSIVTNFKSYGLRIDDDATWEAHCAAAPAPPAVACRTALGVLPLTTGQVFVARGAPNPFRNHVNLSFTLPSSGPVAVEIFSADGRLVQTLAKGEMAAGQHHLTWSMDRDTPSGVYFYRVLAGNNQSTGKLTRMD